MNKIASKTDCPKIYENTQWNNYNLNMTPQDEQYIIDNRNVFARVLGLKKYLMRKNVPKYIQRLITPANGSGIESYRCDSTPTDLYDKNEVYVDNNNNYVVVINTQYGQEYYDSDNHFRWQSNAQLFNGSLNTYIKIIPRDSKLRPMLRKPKRRVADLFEDDD